MYPGSEIVKQGRALIGRVPNRDVMALPCRLSGQQTNLELGR